MGNSDKKVIVGRLGAPHGVKGWLKVNSFTAESKGLFNYGPLLYLKGGNWLPLDIEDRRDQGKAQLVLLKNVDSREAAALLTNSDIAINASQLPETEANEVYWHQLEGMQVVDQHQQLLGEIDYLMETGANDVVVVKPCDGSIDDRERLLPYIASVVLECDVDSRRLSVDWDSEF